MGIGLNSSALARRLQQLYGVPIVLKSRGITSPVQFNLCGGHLLAVQIIHKYQIYVVARVYKFLSYTSKAIELLRVDHAIQLFNDMIQKGVNADVITYSSLIHGLCNFGKDRHGGEKYPSQFTYIYHIGKFFLRARFSKRCRAIVIQAMVRKGLHPDVVTYSALIDRYCLRGELSEAHKVLHRMVKSSVLKGSRCTKAQRDYGALRRCVDQGAGFMNTSRIKLK
ncbi:putative tetratricopeptide-like helical domain-containing protein [Tanacetum coccineum]